MNQIFVKPEKCMACKSCEIACAVQHSKGKNLFSAVLQSPSPMKRIFLEAVGKTRIPIVCRHCADAPCINACKSGCLYRDNKNFVRRKKERCIGCWACIMACPLGVITRDNQKHIAVKCDRCHKLDIPACVRACPTGALVLAETDTMSKEQRQRLVIA